jgi:hypothetical protein
MTATTPRTTTSFPNTNTGTRRSRANRIPIVGDTCVVKYAERAG